MVLPRCGACAATDAETAAEAEVGRIHCVFSGTNGVRPLVSCVDLIDALSTLGVAAGLGLIVGLQRERAASEHGGVRTFTIICLLGAACALLVDTLGPWLIGVGGLGVIAAIVVANLSARVRDGRATTEVAMMLMFVTGVVVAAGRIEIGVALGVALAVLLQAGRRLHTLASKMGDQDVRAGLMFLALTFVILPIVPDEDMGPFDAINPRLVWLLVVLVVGISIGAYVAHKVLGARLGLLATGVFGGLISSTATTMSAARRVRGRDQDAKPSSIVAPIFIVIAATAVVYGRVLVEMFVAGPSFATQAWIPIVIMMGVAAGTAGVTWIWATREKNGNDDPPNPAELKSALAFAAVFTLVLIGVAWANQRFGSAGTYAAAAISGLTDMDAITLTVSRMAHEESTTAGTALRSILIAGISNLVFKAALCWVLGGWRLGWRVGAAFSVQAAAAVALILFWPLE